MLDKQDHYVVLEGWHRAATWNSDVLDSVGAHAVDPSGQRFSAIAPSGSTAVTERPAEAVEWLAFQRAGTSRSGWGISGGSPRLHKGGDTIGWLTLDPRATIVRGAIDEFCGRCRRPEQGRTTSELALADIAKLADIMIAAVDQPIRERLSAALGKERT